MRDWMSMTAREQLELAQEWVDELAPYQDRGHYLAWVERRDWALERLAQEEQEHAPR